MTYQRNRLKWSAKITVIDGEHANIAPQDQDVACQYVITEI